jgi:hypothetical protein
MIEDHLSTNVVINEASGCWEWTSHKDRWGYGRFWALGKVRSAHRASYELHCGPIPDGMHVLHRCDNPTCINPEHLFLGTNAENVADKVAKGRQSRGSMNGAKLTEADVIAIRASKEPIREVAQSYSVGWRHIAKIRRGESWAHLSKVSGA